MAKIRIIRTDEKINRLRKIGIYVDNKKIGTIENGEEKDFEVLNGNQNLKAKIDWCNSNEISYVVDENETKTFKLSGFKYGDFLMKSIVIILMIHFSFQLIFNVDYIIYLIVPVFLVFLYYLTIGKNQYLIISEDNQN